MNRKPTMKLFKQATSHITQTGSAGSQIVFTSILLACIAVGTLFVWIGATASSRHQQDGIIDTVYVPISFAVQQSTQAATATPPSAQGNVPTNDREWDPRLEQRGAILIPAEPAEGQGYWRLIRGRWMDEEESGGRVHIFVDTLNENNARQTGVPLLVAWPDGTTTITTEEKPGEPAANFAMFTWAPAYSIRPNDGNPADMVDGLGLGSIEQPRFNIHTSYDFTWKWTIHTGVPTNGSATPTPTAAMPTATITPTVSLTATVAATAAATAIPTATITAIMTITATTAAPTALPTSTPDGTPTATLIPTSSATPTQLSPPTPAPTNTPTITPIPTATATLWPTALATPVVDEEFFFSSGALVKCEVNPNQTLLRGTVFVGNLPAQGYRVVYDFETTGDGVTEPQITRDNPAGFYEHIISPGLWLVWIVNENSERISVQVPFTIDDAGGNCRIVTVDFHDE